MKANKMNKIKNAIERLIVLGALGTMVAVPFSVVQGAYGEVPAAEQAENESEENAMEGHFIKGSDGNTVEVSKDRAASHYESVFYGEKFPEKAVSSLLVVRADGSTSFKHYFQDGEKYTTKIAVKLASGEIQVHSVGELGALAYKKNLQKNRANAEKSKAALDKLRSEARTATPEQLEKLKARAHEVTNVQQLHADIHVDLESVSKNRSIEVFKNGKFRPEKLGEVKPEQRAEIEKMAGYLKDQGYTRPTYLVTGERVKVMAYDSKGKLQSGLTLEAFTKTPDFVGLAGQAKDDAALAALKLKTQGHNIADKASLESQMDAAYKLAQTKVSNPPALVSAHIDGGTIQVPQVQADKIADLHLDASGATTDSEMRKVIEKLMADDVLTGPQKEQVQKSLEKTHRPANFNTLAEKARTQTELDQLMARARNHGASSDVLNNMQAAYDAQRKAVDYLLRDINDGSIKLAELNANLNRLSISDQEKKELVSALRNKLTPPVVTYGPHIDAGLVHTDFGYMPQAQADKITAWQGRVASVSTAAGLRNLSQEVINDGSFTDDQKTAIRKNLKNLWDNRTSPPPPSMTSAQFKSKIATAKAEDLSGIESMIKSSSLDAIKKGELLDRLNKRKAALLSEGSGSTIPLDGEAASKPQQKVEPAKSKSEGGILHTLKKFFSNKRTHETPDSIRGPKKKSASVKSSKGVQKKGQDDNTEE